MESRLFFDSCGNIGNNVRGDRFGKEEVIKEGRKRVKKWGKLIGIGGAQSQKDSKAIRDS